MSATLSRWLGTVQAGAGDGPAIARLATEDFTFQDVNISAGTQLALFIAANTEPDTFSDAPHRSQGAW